MSLSLIHIYVYKRQTCADVSRALLSSGSSLATAIELTEGADGKLTPVTSGYAILTGSGLAGWLSEEEALGAGLFMGGPGTVSYTHLDVYKRQVHALPIFSIKLQ